jgi:hypothetical protein
LLVVIYIICVHTWALAETAPLVESSASRMKDREIGDVTVVLKLAATYCYTLALCVCGITNACCYGRNVIFLSSLHTVLCYIHQPVPESRAFFSAKVLKIRAVRSA